MGLITAEPHWNDLSPEQQDAVIQSKEYQDWLDSILVADITSLIEVCREKNDDDWYVACLDAFRRHAITQNRLLREMVRNNEIDEEDVEYLDEEDWEPDYMTQFFVIKNMFWWNMLSIDNLVMEYKNILIFVRQSGGASLYQDRIMADIYYDRVLNKFVPLRF